MYFLDNYLLYHGVYLFFFFFQAEDGIRDLVRSRGLGDVYKRQINYLAMSYDHRIIDGREAVLGLVTMKEALEDPSRLLLGV